MNSHAHQIDVDGVIDRLRDAVGVHTDVALSLHFGRSKNVASAWRTRKSVPYAECAKTARQKDVSLDWLIFGIGTGPAVAKGVVAEEAPIYGGADPRASRMVGFIQHWQATRDSDEMVWLERTLARTVPEYAEWLAADKD